MSIFSEDSLFLKVASKALIAGLEELPVVGAMVKISNTCWQVLHDEQERLDHDQRIAQLELAAEIPPSQARQIAAEAIQEAKQQGQAISPERAEAVQDLIAAMPAQIRQRTKATLNQARRQGTALVTVLPVTSQFNTHDRATFYSSLFPQRRPQFQPGDAIPHYNPEWRLEHLLGIGGFGEVWLAKHRLLADEPPQAIKFYQDATYTQMLEREAKNLYRLRKELPAGMPHIVSLLDIQLSETPYWLAFEYIAGGTLESRMRLGAMDWRTTWQLFEPILIGMSQVHALNIVHRDLKPANILLTETGEPQIADFGIGKIVAEHTALTQRTSKTFTTLGYGTQGYMSPEQQD
ncbi:hypothetical protein TI05_16400, partial [Achromatium sp. WMS3]